jgi:hypothetical protein
MSGNKSPDVTKGHLGVTKGQQRSFAGNLVIDPDLIFKGLSKVTQCVTKGHMGSPNVTKGHLQEILKCHTRSNVHISFTIYPSNLKLDLLGIYPKVGHVRSPKVTKGQQVHL